ncbi:MAG: tetratricopeptide repeat protein [Lentimicrobium sp.]|jgi:tetratricopeptide (TPR) repeat protein|nr:tetratricopeptide repeat protein [Lentimicrobium sp.]
MKSVRFSFFVVIVVIATLKTAIAQDVIYLDSLVLLSQETRDNRQKISLLLEAASGYEYTDPNKSLKFAEKACDIAKAEKDEGSIVSALIALGKAHLLLNNFDKAVTYGEEARSMARDLGNKKAMAIAGSLIAVVYGELGEFDKSSGYYFENLKIFEELKDSIEIGVTFGNIGADFLSQSNYTKALEYTQKSLAIATLKKDQVGIAQQLNNMGAIYLEGLKDLKKALVYFRKANAYARRINDTYLLGMTNLNIGLIQSQQKSYDSTLFYYNSSIKYFQEIGQTGKVAECHELIGELYFSLGHRDSSEFHALKAKKLAESVSMYQTLKNSAILLQQLALDRADTGSAFLYSGIISRASDTLFQKQSQKELYKAELRYNQEKLRKELYIKQMRTYYILGFVILTLTSLLLIVLLINSNQRIRNKNTLLEKEKAETELNIRNRELAINIMALIKKNEMLSTINDKLIQLKKELKGDESKKLVANFIRDIDNKMDNKMINEFTTRFQEVHAGFYEKLLESFPRLTPNELKLCAYLRLNMSTKDISELTGQQISTIEQARYRLRKNLGISNSEVNLVTFLSKF